MTKSFLNGHFGLLVRNKALIKAYIYLTIPTL